MMLTTVWAIIHVRIVSRVFFPFVPNDVRRVQATAVRDIIAAMVAGTSKCIYYVVSLGIVSSVPNGCEI